MNLARSYAAQAHAEAGKLYDGQPYVVHLDRVYWYVLKYRMYTNFKPVLLFSGAYLHDILEDCPGVTFQSIKTIFGLNTAVIVDALTNTGARANYDYYRRISRYELAIFLKICDRLANVSYSLEQKNFKKLAMYYNENPLFISGTEAANVAGFGPMVHELNQLFKTYKSVSST